MKPAARIASHLAALGIGVAIAGSLAAFSNITSASEGTVEKRVPSSTIAGKGENGRLPRPGKESRPTLKTAEFRQAWNAVALRKLPKTERKLLQQEILSQWAQVDLEAALHAALGEPWDEDGLLLSEAFSEEFTARPLETWAVIRSGEFGPGVQFLRRVWMQNVSYNNGLLLASMLSELPATLQKEAMEGIMAGSNAGPERDRILAKIIEQSDGQENDLITEAFKNLPADGDPAELRNRWAGLPEGGARRVAMMQWGASLREMEAKDLSAELANVPPESRNEAMKAMISQLNWASPGLLPALEFSMASDEWGTIAKSTASMVANLGSSELADPVELAEWGGHLPQRPDTVEIYHKAIGRYIRDDLPRAKVWLEAMPEGSWQRENGLAEFSQQALWSKNDPESSQWALDAITDPAVKAEATKWRGDWQKQTNGGKR